MRRILLVSTTSWALAALAASVLNGCSGDENAVNSADSEVIPDNGPLPANFPTRAEDLPTACATKDWGTANRMVRGVNREYKDSSAIDYVSPGWENRIAKDDSFFNEEVTKEPENRNGTAYSVVLIDIRKVNGKPHYYYYGNGNAVRPTENWSSTKMIGVGMALHRLRFESDGKIGGDATFPGGSVRDDMDDVNDRSSNVFGGWYKAVAGPSRANQLLSKWLGRTGESIGGFYGVSSWLVAYYDVLFTSASGNLTKRFKIDDRSEGDNSLSMMTQAEFMKRIGVNFQDAETLPKMVDYTRPLTPEAIRKAPPSWTKADIITMMYGDYPAGKRGGMMFDGLRDLPRSFSKNGDLGEPSHDHLDRISDGKWYAVAKGGSGCSSSRSKCEEALMAYMCIPGANGGEGVEFAIAARLSVPSSQGSPLARLWKTYQRVIDEAYPGLREGSSPATSNQPKWCRVKSSVANAREKPEGSVLITLQNGASVRATSKVGSWYQVDFRLSGKDWNAFMHESVIDCPQ